MHTAYKDECGHVSSEKNNNIKKKEISKRPTINQELNNTYVTTDPHKFIARV